MATTCVPLPIASTREGRKAAHSRWRWNRLEKSPHAVAAQQSLVRHIKQLEEDDKAGNAMKILNIGADSVDVELGKAISYDGVWKKIERILCGQSIGRKIP